MNNELIEKAIDAALRKQIAILEKGVIPTPEEVKLHGKVIHDPHTGYYKYLWKTKHIVTLNNRGEVTCEVLTA